MSSSATPSAAAAAATPHCTICCAPPDSSETATLPACTHSFCLPCILSWALADARRLCPNCKTPFPTLLTPHDAATGAPLASSAEAAIDLLLAAPWCSADLTTPVPADEALSAAVSIPRPAPLEARRELARAGASSGVAVYACEEVEDELEARFWAAREREDDRYDSVLDGVDLARASRRRVVGNRRNGAGGFVASGRLIARVAPQADGAGPSGAGGENGGMGKEPKVPREGGGGKRKKKVKKNSRQGAAAAKAAKEAAKAAAAAASEEVGVEGENMEEAAVVSDAAAGVAAGLGLLAVGGA